VGSDIRREVRGVETSCLSVGGVWCFPQARWRSAAPQPGGLRSPRAGRSLTTSFGRRHRRSCWAALEPAVNEWLNCLTGAK